MRRGINHLPIAVVGGVLDALSGAVSMAGRAVLEPVSTVSGILGYARSGIRVLNRAAEPSPLLRRRSLTTRTEAIDIRLADLHKAAKAGGGSINDAYLAGLCGALRRYHGPWACRSARCRWRCRSTCGPRAMRPAATSSPVSTWRRRWALSIRWLG